ncbi:hypothetical protein MNB_SV-6-1420 [hydrothermal vent metagenome]|uniref:DUF2853 domain-containing protein n=1 Tax=hydrothermal vent metagenome TaxID=652676 RepID=A0A1W1BLS3_9ZZZZ
MNKRDEKIELYRKFIADNNLTVDDDLLVKVTMGLGPSIHNKNSELIACSSSSELATVRDNFLKKKLGLTLSDDELDSAIEEVCQEIGSSIKNKYRAVFYALLVTKLKQESYYA